MNIIRKVKTTHRMGKNIYKSFTDKGFIARTNDSMDCSLVRASLNGIILARVLEWVAISYFRK